MIEEILNKIGDYKSYNGYYMAHCPCHDDKRKSLMIKKANGKVYVKCFAGCQQENVLKALNVDSSNFSRKYVTSYFYKDEQGNVIFKKDRFEIANKTGRGKDFAIFRLENGMWVRGLKESTRRVLYNLPEVVKAETVFLTEGEKDADSLIELGFVATTNYEGAGAWKKEYTEVLKNKNIILVLDNDNPGLKRGEMLLQELSGKSIKVLIPFENEKKDGKDITDWIEIRKKEGKTNKEIYEEIKSIVENLEEKRKPNGTFLKDYRIKSDGLYHVSYEKDNLSNLIVEKETWVSSPIRLLGWTRNEESTDWGRLVEFPDGDGITHRIIIQTKTLQGDGKEAIDMLSDCGLIISRKMRGKLLDYLLLADNGERFISVETIGWHNNTFILPDASFGRDKIVLQSLDASMKKFRTRGKLEDWQNEIAKFASGNSRLIFAISLAFSPILMKFAREQSGGFHFRGPSSIGKTTASFVAGSVWGGDKHRGFIETWRTTANGLEAIAQSHNNALLILDEISQVSPKDISSIIYTLSNGFGKNRMTKNISSRKKLDWQLLFLSNGERSLEDILIEAGERAFGGQQTRLIDIEADTGKYGIFEELHGFASGAELSKHLIRASCMYFGTPARVFLEEIINNYDIIEETISEAQALWHEKVKSLGNASGEVFRVAQRFGLVTIAGEMATRFGITKWKRFDAHEAGEKIFEEWVSNRGGLDNYDIVTGVAHVIGFLQSNGYRFADVENENFIFVKDLAGFRKGSKFYIFPRVFREECCKNHDYRKVAKEMAKRGYLFPAPDGSFYRKERLPYWKEGKPDNFYVVSLLSLDERSKEETEEEITWKNI
ncbi:MAG: DUF927 domain-containing protein [Leptospiraceae bacterium]|nr:DUF927 domain-containing protein [Leptospiraceae bacterium]